MGIDKVNPLSTSILKGLWHRQPLRQYDAHGLIHILTFKVVLKPVSVVDMVNKIILINIHGLHIL
jgi:hypothetical protein